MSVNRSEFLAAGALVAGALSATAGGRRAGRRQGRNMCGSAADPIPRVRVGIIGLGMRGHSAVSRLAKIRDLEIVALCDLRESMVDRAKGLLKAAGRPPAKTFSGDEEAWKKLVDLDLDLVYVVTPWHWHTPMAVYAMKHGKHVACEVPAAMTIEECRALTETSEATGRHMMQLENCCYDFFELTTLNMVRNGVFGELTHVEGAYLHTLSELIARKKNGYQGMWRFKQNNARNGNLYPTHGLGPIAQCLNVNRGNRFDYLVSMSSKQSAFTEWARTHDRPDLANLTHYRGDMNCTLIKCENGETILVKHDVSTPRPYSRIHSIQGSKGMVRKWPQQEMAFDHKGWLAKEEMAALEERYRHPLTRTIGEMARKVGGHGGMDFIMDYRLIYCLKNGLPLDQDVYDAAAWSAVGPLSRNSTAHRGRSVDVPDFTRGAWKTNKPLGIVDVDPEKLPASSV